VIPLLKRLMAMAAPPRWAGVVAPYASSHTHAIADTTGLQTALDGKQPVDADLTAIGGLSPTNGDTMLRVAGAWLNQTMAQLKTALGLVKGDVGLGNVDNTSNATERAASATLQNKTIDGGSNTLQNIKYYQIDFLDNDNSFGAALTTKAPTSWAVKSYADTKFSISGGSLSGYLTLHADPSSAMHAVTKQYVDSLALNLGKRGRPRVATTGNVTISTALNAGDTIDGVTLVAGDLVLVVAQTAPAENGVYVAGVTPARAAEFDSYDEHPGTLFAVAEGTTQADTVWLCTSNAGGTLGSSAIVFAPQRVSGELLAANNLSDLANAGTARTNLGVVIGTHVQAYHANHAAFAGLSLVADRLPYANGAGTLALATFTSQARNLLDDATAGDMQTTLGGTTTGKALFTAADAAAGRTALSTPYYEEGTFTPTMTAATAPTGVTYSSQSGTYTRIGRIYDIRLRVTLSSKGSGGSGVARIGGFPATPAGSRFSTDIRATLLTLSSGQIPGIVVGTTNDLQFSSNTGVGDLDWSAVSGTSDFIISLVYNV
jgi:hypothetical protein